MIMTDHNRANKARERLSGSDLLEMFSAAAGYLEANEGPINRLNVFPVPDGDTGTNMMLTLREMVGQVRASGADTAEEVSASMARASLMSSRGNSGLIVSQLFKGMAVEFAGKAEVGPSDLAAALETGARHAYRVIGAPVEGTILTVLRGAAAAATRLAAEGGTLAQVLDCACGEAWKALELTPSMLPRLREAKVVDAGGQGLWVILEAMRLWAGGADCTPVEIAPAVPVIDEEAGRAYAAAGQVSVAFLDATEEEQYGFCTQFLVQGTGLDPDGMREQMSERAMSAVVLGDDSMLKVHVHTEEPDGILAYAQSLGMVSHVSVQDMDEQHREYSAARRSEATGPSEGPPAGPASVSVVAIAWGDGLEALFAREGAAVLVAGDTMNPSVQQIADKIEDAPTENVIVLPNNPNIVPAARQAAAAVKKSVRVVPATTIPEGVVAILEFLWDRGLDENADTMEARLADVRTGEVTTAVRDAEIDGVCVAGGQTIGLLDRRLIVAGDDPTTVLLALLEKASVVETEIITLYWGAAVNERDAQAAGDLVREALPDVEIEVLRGGQPHYHYIVSIE